MTGEKAERTIIQPAATAARDRWMHRMLWAAFALLAASLVLSLVHQWSLSGTVDTLQERSDQNSRAAAVNADAAQRLSDQVRQLGAVPVVAAPAAGPVGATGPAGQTGPVGPKGDTGIAGPSGPTGPPGAQGAAGQNGSDGSNGSDGKVGATGAAGPQGPQGEPGPAGPQGPQGPQGEQGPPGPTCPSGYTAQSRKQGSETWWVCVADTETTTTTTP